MKFNTSGNYLLLQGEFKIWSILLPHTRGGGVGSSTKQESTGISCRYLHIKIFNFFFLFRTIQVGTDLSNSLKFKKIIQIEWHPLSDVHVVILTSDNKLRFKSIKNKTKIFF